MNGILQGNAALAFGVLALVFVLAATVQMRRPALAVLAAAALFAAYAVFHVNDKLATGEAVPPSEQNWFTNAGIIAWLLMIVAAAIAHWMHRLFPCDSDDKTREVLSRSNTAVRAHR
jgi:lysylphosphatidylglycerol synthetase-like protein (DUF2156 family)